MNRRRFLAGVAAAGLALPAAARGQAPIPESRGIVRVGFSALPTAWDPLGSASFATRWLSTLVYDSLFQINPVGGIVPGLALFSSWSADKTVLSLDLRTGVRFADGSLVTARDVVMSLERAREVSWRLESVRSISATSDRTVEIVTDRPDVALVASLASPDLAILPGGASDFEALVAAGDPPAGTGPFRPLRLRDEDIRLLPNSWYWQIGRPRIGGIRIVGVPEESNRSVALLTDMVDFVPDIPLLDVSLLNQEQTTTLVGGASMLGCMLILNTRTSPMSERSFRLLFNRAIDRTALVDAATGGQATPQQVLLPLDHWAALDDMPDSYDREEVRQAFRNLGYPVGLRLRMISDERNIALSNSAVFMQDQLAFVGISLTVDLLDEGALALALAVGDYDLYATNIDGWNDPHELFRPLVAADGDRNVGGYRSANCDRLIRSAVTVESESRRAPYYQQVQRILLQDVPLVVLYLQNYFDSMTSRLQNYAAYPPVSGLGMRHARWGSSSN